MKPHHLHFRSLISSYATVRPQRRRELKLLSTPDYFSSCFNTPQISCYHSGHLRLVSSPGPCKRAPSAIAGCHSYPTSSSHGGRDKNAIGNKEKSKRRKRKQTATKQGVLSPPSEEELSTRMVNNLYQSGDPLGRKELGQRVVQWLKQGMHLMASKFASSDQSETQDNDPLCFHGHMGFVMQAQAYLSATAMPRGQEALCLKASTHYPTLFDNFQRELRDVLLQQQEEGLVTDWRSTRSWMLMKEMARSAEHRTAARRPTAPVMHKHTTLGISLDRTRLMQAKIDEFVQKMTGLLQLERDAELDVTQTTQDELMSASSMMDGKSKKPVEYLVTHGQAQEECDTICNLKVISSSTGMFFTQF